MKRFLVLVLALVCFRSLAAGPFALEDGGKLAISWRGTPLIQSERFNILPEDGFGKYEQREETIGNDRVVNSFGEFENVPFRREIVIKDGGKEAEISIQFDVPAYSKHADNKGKVYSIMLPFQSFAGWSYEAVSGRIYSTKVLKGVIDPETKSGNALIENARPRQVKLTSPDGKRSIVLDWSPEGVNDDSGDDPCNSINSLWGFRRIGDEIHLEVGYSPRFYGGSVAGKLMIYEGTPENVYELRHAQKDFDCYSILPADRQYLFGAKKFGKGYTPIHDAAYTEEQKAGWVQPDALQLQSFHDSGALYSAVRSGKTNTFRMSGLRKGVHLLTLGLTAYDQAVGPMNVTVNGQKMLEKFSLPKREVAMVTLPIWIENGTAEIVFSGNWQVSTVSDQLLQSSAEDFSFRRGFWVSHKGPHPAVLFHSEHYRKEPEFKLGVSQYPLLVPGEEMKAPLKKQNYETGHAVFAPGNDWRSGAIIGAPGPSNVGHLSEFTDPAAAKKRITEMKDENINIALINGLLTRHTYACHGERIRKEIRKMTDVGHPLGMKFIDHWDFSLLENNDSGFRVLTERTDQLQHTIAEGLPNRGLCPSNPKARELLAQEVLRYIKESNIDGIMIDEATFHGKEFCGCGECRRKFTADTGWYLPVDETSPELNNKQSPLWRTWEIWREKAVGDFWLALREKVRAERKDFVFIGYTTHYGVYSDFGSIWFGLAMEQLARTWDMIGTEIMSRNIFASYRSVASFRRLKNMFRRQCPVFGLVYSATDTEWNVLYFGWALNNLNAQATWEATGVPCPEGAPNYRKFDQKAGNFDSITARSMAKTALLFSTRGRDCGQDASSHIETLGLSQILEKHHVPHDFVMESDFTPEVLKNYSLVVVGNATSMSQDDVDALAAYAKAGGTVWFSAFAGNYDGIFMKDENWYAGKVLLNGSDPGGKPQRFYTMVDPKSNQSWTLQGKHYYLPRNFSDDLETLMLLKDDKGDTFPGLVMAKLGKGRVFYTPSALAESSMANEMTVNEVVTFVPDPAAEDLVWAVFGKIAPADVYAWNPLNVPEQVVTSLYTTPDDKLCVHFLNATKSNYQAGDKIPSDVPAGAFDPLPQEIKFRVDHPAKQVYAVSPEWDKPKALPFQTENGRTEVTIPGGTLGCYMIVWLEK